MLLLLHCKAEYGYCWLCRYKSISETLLNKYNKPCLLNLSLSTGCEASGNFVFQYGQGLCTALELCFFMLKSPLAKINEKGNGAWGSNILFSFKVRDWGWFLLSIKHVKEIFPVIRTLDFVLEKKWNLGLMHSKHVVHF